MFGRFAVIGDRLSPFVSVACIVMARLGLIGAGLRAHQANQAKVDRLFGGAWESGNSKGKDGFPCFGTLAETQDLALKG